MKSDMNLDELQNKIRDEALRILENAESKIPKFVKTVNAEAHFIPKRDRAYAKLIQSMIISYGTAIENVIRFVIDKSGTCEVISGYNENSGNYIFKVPEKEDLLISEYISKTKNVSKNKASDEQLTKDFDLLMDKINKYDGTGENIIQRDNDIDLLFRKKDDLNHYYYVEIKYKDNHDSGKNEDIAHKLLRTSMYLTNEYKQEDVIITPMLYFYIPTSKKSKYLPKKTILSGRQLFDEFSLPYYEEIEKLMNDLSMDPLIIEKLNELRQKIYN